MRRLCMGQSQSPPEKPPPTRHKRSCSIPTSFFSKSSSKAKAIEPDTESGSTRERSDSLSLDSIIPLIDYTSEIPDECLAIVFQSLPSRDRTQCTLVCKRWYVVEGQYRHRLALRAQSDILPSLPSLFNRFDSVTKLALRCERKLVSLSDEALVLISLQCRNLTRVKLRNCREITDAGMVAFAANCRSLRKLSCGSCVFGVAGINAVLRCCTLLEEISIKRLRGINHDHNVDNGDGNEVVEAVVRDLGEAIEPGLAALSLKSICLKELYNGQLFAPLIIGANKLKTLKVIRCLGDWDTVFENLASNDRNKKKISSLVEVHLERIQVTDIGLSALSSSCVNLEVLHLVKTPECSNLGIVNVTEQCKLLRKVHIDGWKTNRIGDQGLSALGKYCVNLQELVLIGINPTTLSLGLISENCKGLERLALCSSETIGDVALSCIASKCMSLKKFCIKNCPITDNGLEALAVGCPNLVKIKVKRCKEVTREIMDLLKVKKESLIVNLDVDSIEAVDASGSEGGGAHEDGADMDAVVDEVAPAVGPSRRNGRGSLLRFYFNFLFPKNRGHAR